MTSIRPGVSRDRCRSGLDTILKADAANTDSIYLLLVSIPSMSPEDFRAAAETHRELGPEYSAAVVESFLDKVGREIDARVDHRVAQAQLQQPQAPAKPAQQGRQLALAIVSMALGIPLTAIITAVSKHDQLAELAIVWLVIAVINVAYTLGNRPQPPRR